MIHIKTKKLRFIPDERGFLMELLRCDDSIFEKFGQVYITSCKHGFAKAWHYHKKQTDNFVCVFGKALVVLYDMRKNSPTFGEVMKFILCAPPDCKKNILVKIPPGVVHGFTAISKEIRIINIPTLPYKYVSPDEFRLPWNSKDISFKWPRYVKSGG